MRKGFIKINNKVTFYQIKLIQTEKELILDELVIKNK